MALRDRAVLTLTVDGTQGEFHLMHAESNEEQVREFLMGKSGQAIAEFATILTGTGTGQEGAWLDAGQGDDTITLSFKTGYERDEYDGVPVQWGDGSSGTDQWDATGAHPQTKKQVLKWWSRNARTDSFRSEANLHWGEWTDGSIDGEAGIFGEPITVVVRRVTLDRDDESPSSTDGTVELIRASSLTEIGGPNDPSSGIPDLL